MAALILPSSSPPRGPAPVNWANPITRGLVIAYFASSNFDHAGTRVPNNTDKTNNQQSANQYGAAMRFTGSQAVNTLTFDHKVTHNLSSATAMTVVTVTTAAAGAERPICGVWGSTNRWYMAISSAGYPLFAVNGGAANRVYTANVVTAFGPRTSLAAVWDGSSDTCKLYKAGVEISGGKTGTAQTAIGSHTIGPSIGSQSTGGTAKHSGTIEYVLVFNRALSAAEIRSISENPYQILRAKKSYLIDAITGLSSVSNDVVLTYNTLSAAQSDNTISWNVVNSVSQDGSILWNLQNSVSSDNSISWDLISQVISDKGLSWDTLSSAVKDGVLSWDSISSVASNTGVSWNVVSSVFVDKSINYDVLANVTSNQSTSWNIAQFVFADKSIEWDISSTMLTAFADIALRYDIVSNVYQDFNTYWDLLQQVGSNQQIDFDILTSVLSDKAITWGIAEAVANDLTIVANLLQNTGQDLSITWDSAGIVSGDLVIKYNISTDAVILPPIERILKVSLQDRTLKVLQQSIQDRTLKVVQQSRVLSIQ